MKDREPPLHSPRSTAEAQGQGPTDQDCCIKQQRHEVTMFRIEPCTSVNLFWPRPTVLTARWALISLRLGHAVKANYRCETKRSRNKWPYRDTIKKSRKCKTEFHQTCCQYGCREKMEELGMRSLAPRDWEWQRGIMRSISLGVSRQLSWKLVILHLW